MDRKVQLRGMQLWLLELRGPSVLFALSAMECVDQGQGEL